MNGRKKTTDECYNMRVSKIKSLEKVFVSCYVIKVCMFKKMSIKISFGKFEFSVIN